MTTLMQWGNSEGIHGRCDAKCHEAKDPVCRCMCGGQFHGAALAPGGIRKAVEEAWEPVFVRAQAEVAARGFFLDGRPDGLRQMELVL